MSKQTPTLMRRPALQMQWLLGLFGILALSSACADDFNTARTGWYVSPMLSIVDDNQNRNVDDGIANLHIGVGKKFSANKSLEFKAIAVRLNADGFNADQLQWGLGADYIHELKGTDWFIPYGVVGGGYIKTQNDNPFEEDGGGLMASLGAGVLVRLNNSNYMLRADLRVRNDRSTDSQQDILLGFGVHRFIKPAKIVVLDADNDGVSDADDRCGDTPPDKPVDSFGCAR